MKKLFFVFAMNFATTVCRGGLVLWGDAYLSGNYFTVELLNGCGIPMSSGVHMLDGFGKSMEIETTFTSENAILKSKKQIIWSSDIILKLIQTERHEVVDAGLFTGNSDMFYKGGDGVGIELVIPKTNEDFSNTVLLAFNP